MTRKLRGFSLIETLIGVVIVGLCVLAVTGGINFCLATLQSSRQWARSSDILLDMAERLSLVRWD
jgi:prepilin-type N-terminal cleavage/methylation domain-containing protein